MPEINESDIDIGFPRLNGRGLIEARMQGAGYAATAIFPRLNGRGLIEARMQGAGYAATAIFPRLNGRGLIEANCAGGASGRRPAGFPA